jgi:hypothetical protein
MVDPARDDIAALLSELGGLDLGLTSAVHEAAPQLPGFVPQVDGTAITRGFNGPWVAVNLGVFMRRAGFRRPRSRANLRERLGLPATTKILFLAFGPDRLLDYEVWPNRAKFVDALTTWRPDLAVAPDFSVWHGDPWLTQRVNIVRSLRVFEAMQAAGIAAVPHIYWSSRKDAVEWASWLRSTNVPLVAVDLQCIGSGLRHYVRELAAFREMLNHAPRLLISGVRPGPRLHEIRNVWPESSYTADLIRLAAKRRELVRGGDGRYTIRLRPAADPAQLYRNMTLAAQAEVSGGGHVAAA